MVWSYLFRGNRWTSQLFRSDGSNTPEPLGNSSESKLVVDKVAEGTPCAAGKNTEEVIRCDPLSGRLTTEIVGDKRPLPTADSRESLPPPPKRQRLGCAATSLLRLEDNDIISAETEYGEAGVLSLGATETTEVSFAGTAGKTLDEGTPNDHPAQAYPDHPSSVARIVFTKLSSSLDAALLSKSSKKRGPGLFLTECLPRKRQKRQLDGTASSPPQSPSPIVLPTPSPAPSPVPSSSPSPSLSPLPSLSPAPSISLPLLSSAHPSLASTSAQPGFVPAVTTAHIYDSSDDKHSNIDIEALQSRKDCHRADAVVGARHNRSEHQDRSETEAAKPGRVHNDNILPTPPPSAAKSTTAPQQHIHALPTAETKRLPERRKSATHDVVAEEAFVVCRQTKIPAVVTLRGLLGIDATLTLQEKLAKL